MSELGERLKKIFHEFDADKRFVISRDRLTRVLKTLNPTFTDAELSKLFDIADKDHNGVIDYREFIDFVCPPKDNPRGPARVETRSASRDDFQHPHYRDHDRNNINEKHSLKRPISHWEILLDDGWAPWYPECLEFSEARIEGESVRFNFLHPDRQMDWYKRWEERFEAELHPCERTGFQKNPKTGFQRQLRRIGSWELQTDNGWEPWHPGVAFNGAAGERVEWSHRKYNYEARFESDVGGVQTNKSTGRTRPLRQNPVIAFANAVAEQNAEKALQIIRMHFYDHKPHPELGAAYLPAPVNPTSPAGSSAEDSGTGETGTDSGTGTGSFEDKHTLTIQRPVLPFCAKMGLQSLVSKLLQLGADPDATCWSRWKVSDMCGGTEERASYFAAIRGDVQMMRELIKYKADVNAKVYSWDYEGCNGGDYRNKLLTTAAEHADVVNLLLAAKANPNVVDEGTFAGP